MSEEYDRQLFGEIESFCDITVEGVVYRVPEKLELLRVFQFLDFEIDYSRLCWNATCQRCFIDYLRKEKSFRALSCRTRSFEGMVIEKLPSTIRVPVDQNSSKS